jgi:tRNA(Ile)-lysidine synthase
MACAAAQGHLRGLTAGHVEQILKVADRRSAAETCLPGGLRASLREGRLTIAREHAVRPRAVPREALCPIPGEVTLPGFGMRLRVRLAEGSLADGALADLAPGPGRACLDADLLGGPLLVRPRRPGDRFRPLGAPGSRTLKTFLIDRKVPVDERGHVPIVLSGQKIAWVVGHQIDDRFKVTPGTRRILVLEKEPR